MPIPLRVTSALAAAALAVPGLLTTAPTQAFALVNCSSNDVLGDLDSDGKADVVAGVPEYDNARGAIDVLFSSGTRAFFTAADLGLPASAAGDRFGAAVTLQDIDLDGCDDLAIGAPGRSSSKGAVYLVRSNGNAQLSSFRTYSGTDAHGSFGQSLLFLAPEKLTPGGWVRTNLQLVVGTPTADDGGRDEAGAIWVLPLAANGTLAGPSKRISQNSSGVPGASENFDRFGAVLAGSGRTIAVGAPTEAIGSRADAGSVTFLTATQAAPMTFTGSSINQNSTGVPGTAEIADQFGGSLAMKDNYVLIGVPGEDIGSAVGTGAVLAGHYQPSTKKFTTIRSVDQNSSGIPGANETGDAFGSSVALGTNTFSQLTAIVGAPGEDIGSASNAGAVTMFRANNTGGSAVGLRQGAGGIGGAAEAGDRFGASVSALRGDLADGEAIRDGVVIGVPGEDIGPIADTGAVIYTRNTTNWFTLLLEDTGSPDLPEEVGFGEVLATSGGTP